MTSTFVSIEGLTGAVHPRAITTPDAGRKMVCAAGGRRGFLPGLARLPVLALLLGALGLFAAAPAQAQSHIWSATLTVDDIDDDGAYLGCDTSTCSSQLTEDELEHNGERYTVAHLYYNNGPSIP